MRLWLGGLAVAAFVLAAPATSSADTITFEDVPAGQFIVNTQYNDRGVTFNDLRLVTYPAGFAHSGAKGVEGCYAAEQCTASARASFTTGQTQVGIWVGNNYPAGSPLDIRLTALDSNGSPIGTPANATLPAGANPIATHLQITVGSPSIYSFKVGYTSDGGSGGLALDDVEFSTAGPPPPCTAIGPADGHPHQPGQQHLPAEQHGPAEGQRQPRGAPITERDGRLRRLDDPHRHRLSHPDRRQRRQLRDQHGRACSSRATKSSSSPRPTAPAPGRAPTRSSPTTHCRQRRASSSSRRWRSSRRSSRRTTRCR